MKAFEALLLGILAIVVGLVAMTAFYPQKRASQVIRLDQTNSTQYTNSEEYNTWSNSSCSAAAMAEVINAYGHNFTVHDVLSVEIQQQQITTSEGMLNGLTSITQTVKQFGFQAFSISDNSFNGIVSTANNGTPVIISIRNANWPNGHILVATGGDSQTIKIVDSYSTDVTSFSRADFTSYWTGLAVLVTGNINTPTSTVTGTPSITPDFIDKMLCKYHSPACGTGQDLFNDGLKANIDPAYALAFFWTESNFATKGEARDTKSLGNLRCIDNEACTDGYASFDTWNDGYIAWYSLISQVYVQKWGDTTVDAIIPKYAPNTDNNNEQSYISTVKNLIGTWRNGNATVSTI